MAAQLLAARHSTGSPAGPRRLPFSDGGGTAAFARPLTARLPKNKLGRTPVIDDPGLPAGGWMEAHR